MRKVIRDLIERVRYRHLPVIDRDSVAEHVKIVSGRLDPDKLTVFSYFKDEMFFCEAFFRHYRDLGVEQFLIIDDNSTDGTQDFLRAQSDCVVLASSVPYGEFIKYRRLDGRIKVSRAGVAFKSLVQSLFFHEKFSIYVDADEFLILPPGVRSIREVLTALGAEGRAAIVGPMVEFFAPAIHADGAIGVPPASLEELLEECCFFETTPLVELAGNGRYTLRGPSKTEALFARYGLALTRASGVGKKHAIAHQKTPILYHSDTHFRLGSHRVNVPVSDTIMLPLIHFVYTRNFIGKVNRAVSWGSHVDGGLKYKRYRDLFDKMAAQNASMLTDASRKYSSPQDFIDAGHMKFPAIPRSDAS